MQRRRRSDRKSRRVGKEVQSSNELTEDSVKCFFFSSRRRHTRWTSDWSSDVCSSDLTTATMSRAAIRSSTCGRLCAAPALHSANGLQEDAVKSFLFFFIPISALLLNAETKKIRSEEPSCRERGSKQ